MDGGNGWRFASYTAESGRLFLRDQARHGGGKPSRRERLVAVGVAFAVLAGWGLWKLLAG